MAQKLMSPRKKDFLLPKSIQAALKWTCCYQWLSHCIIYICSSKLHNETTKGRQATKVYLCIRVDFSLRSIFLYHFISMYNVNTVTKRKELSLNCTHLIFSPDSSFFTAFLLCHFQLQQEVLFNSRAATNDYVHYQLIWQLFFQLINSNLWDVKKRIVKKFPSHPTDQQSKTWRFNKTEKNSKFSNRKAEIRYWL